MLKILLVEDDEAIVKSLVEYLSCEGYSISNVQGQTAAEAIMKKENFDLMLVDIALTDGNGYNVCNEARKLKIPVIFLTASGDENSVVRGLDMGAEDYIAKPFRPRELLSRIKGVLRRNEGAKTLISIGSITVDTEKGTVCKNGEAVVLSALEYKLLNVFVNNRGILLSRNRLLEEIWDIGGDFVNDNTLTVYIKRLREKLETDAQNPELIKTVRGLGYRMD